VGFRLTVVVESIKIDSAFLLPVLVLLQEGLHIMSTPITIDYLAKKNFHQRDARIVFHEGPHVYEIDGSSDKYVSVTTLNHGYFPQFDSEKIVDGILRNTKRMADAGYKYYGMTRESILASWAENGRSASEAGTKMHLDIELFYNRVPVENTSFEYELFQKFVADYPQLEAFRTEWTVFDEDLKIAGSIDMVFRNTATGKYEIYDWKRVKEISMTAFRDDDVGLVGPLKTMPNTNYWHYALQLNVYQYILKKRYGLDVSNRCLIVMHPENAYRRYMRYELPDLQEVVGELMALRAQEVAPVV
jgi:hypothetical protein